MRRDEYKSKILFIYFCTLKGSKVSLDFISQKRNLDYLASLCIYFLKIYISANHTKNKMIWYSKLILEGEN